jgi:hypothetical protein
VIRAYGGRGDITSLRQPGAGAAWNLCGEATRMKAAILEKPAAGSVADTDRLRDVVLVRIAGAVRGTTRPALAADLAPMAAHGLAPARARALLDREIELLIGAGLAKASGSRIEATETGVARAAAFLGLKGPLPRHWEPLRDVRLVARALGLHREPARRLEALATPEGLRAAIVQHAYKIKTRGAPTNSRLRSALASVALLRAFGNQIAAGLGGKTGLSAKAGRLLAAQLARKPRNFGTDGRLIAALAAEHVAASQPDLESLRIALLRQFIDGETAPRPAPAKRVAPPAPTPIRLQPPPPAPAPVAAGRPDLGGFAQEVRRHAAAQAHGWVGDRKAYISHVWRRVRQERPDWALSEIEFKCMLAEAHRLGQLALANADLKADSNIQDLRASAVVYKNAVFHFIRVDG